VEQVRARPEIALDLCYSFVLGHYGSALFFPVANTVANIFGLVNYSAATQLNQETRPDS